MLLGETGKFFIATSDRFHALAVGPGAALTVGVTGAGRVLQPFGTASVRSCVPPAYMEHTSTLIFAILDYWCWSV